MIDEATAYFCYGLAVGYGLFWLMTEWEKWQKRRTVRELDLRADVRELDDRVSDLQGRVAAIAGEKVK